MSELKALLFDVDGTLADTERDGHRIAFNRAFAQAGLDWEWPEALYGRLLAISGGKERMEYYLRERTGGAEPSKAELALIADLHAIKNRYYWEMLDRGEIGLRPGVERLLREARAAGLRLAVATTTTGGNVRSLLRNTLGAQAEGWFELIASADEVSDKKPSPAVYEYCLRQLGLAAAECIAFEDSENGMAATSAAGIRVIITVNGYTEDGDYAGAELVLDTLGEPGAPCRVLGGRAAARAAVGDCVDVDLLRRL
jgi:beta-phosphoglucomutase-like phosphatase (HAD superfamily)